MEKLGLGRSCDCLITVITRTQVFGTLISVFSSIAYKSQSLLLFQPSEILWLWCFGRAPEWGGLLLPEGWELSCSQKPFYICWIVEHLQGFYKQMTARSLLVSGTHAGLERMLGPCRTEDFKQALDLNPGSFPCWLVTHFRNISKPPSVSDFWKGDNNSTCLTLGEYLIRQYT